MWRNLWQVYCLTLNENSGGLKQKNWGGVRGVKYELESTKWFR